MIDDAGDDLLSERNDATMIAKAGNHVETVVDGEVVLMHVDSGRFYSLGQTGRRMWELLDTHPSLPALVTAMTGEYDVPADRCEADLRDILKALEQRKLITLS